VGAAWFVTFGAIMAITTSMNSTMLVPSRLGIILARDGLAPKWMGAIHPRTGTPVYGLTITVAASALLLISHQIALALNVAVFALVILYFLHSIVYLRLARRNPALHDEITIAIPLRLQRGAAWVSALTTGGLIAVQIAQDLQTLQAMSLRQRIDSHALTSVELVLAWGAVGLALYAIGRRRGQLAQGGGI
jgi:amino acid transporter